MRCEAFALALVLTTATGAFAAGGAGSGAPEPTQTSTECKNGQIWDEATKVCVDAKDSRLNDDIRFDAARELAYAGQYDHALGVLAAMAAQDEPRVLTYMGFANRKAGRIEIGMAYYRDALAIDPDFILARSYMGQGFVEQDEIAMAEAELSEIVARGGAGTWAETSLRQAIATGITYSH